MELRVAAVVLLMVAMCAAHGERYVVKKMVKAAPQYQPYSVKSQGKKTPLPALYLRSAPEQQLWQLCFNFGSLDTFVEKKQQQ